MNFIVVGRRDIAKLNTGKLFENRTGLTYKITEPHCIISFTDPKSTDAHIPPHELTKGILRLKFNDIDRVDHPEKTAITDANGREIWEFFKKHKEEITLCIVHCEAGISRSSGCAAALSKAVDNTDERFFRYFHPNMLVYRKVLTAAVGEIVSGANTDDL